MRVDYIKGKYIVYLKNSFIKNEEICNYIKNKLKEIYNIELKGMYDATIYHDKRYGNIVELENNYAYNDYYSCDFRIIKREVKFLIKIDDILDKVIDKYYIYKNEFYVNYSNKIYGEIIYKNTNSIKNKCVNFTNS